MEPVLSKLLISIVFISAILNIIAYKKRWLAGHFLTLECVTRIVAIMIPNAAGYYYRNGLMHMVVFAGVFGMFFCGSGYELIFISLT